ncbi:MAG: hypothetical protein ACREJO_02800 [Phycisphaerales bacterium]
MKLKLLGRLVVAPCVVVLGVIGLGAAESATHNQEAVAAVKSGGLSTIRVRPCICLDRALANSDTCYVSTVPRTSWGTPPVPVPCDFDVVYGSSPGGMVDGHGIFRSPGSLGIASSATDGSVLSIKGGYAIASGKFPLLAGLRIRAASDGTQFAIEVLSNTDGAGVTHVTERVYFLSTMANKPVNVRVFRDDAQTVEEPGTRAQLLKPGEFCEVTWDTSMIKMPTPSKDEMSRTPNTDVLFFFAEMYIVLGCGTIPREPECKVTSERPITRFEVREVQSKSIMPVVYDSLMTRFVSRFDDKDSKGTVTTLVPLPVERQQAPAK